jgi:hypothetical protein
MHGADKDIVPDTLRADGSVRRVRVDRAERGRILVEEVGIAKTIVRRLAEDTATQPPPGSQAAQSTPAACGSES